MKFLKQTDPSVLTETRLFEDAVLYLHRPEGWETALLSAFNYVRASEFHYIDVVMGYIDEEGSRLFSLGRRMPRHSAQKALYRWKLSTGPFTFDDKDVDFVNTLKSLGLHKSQTIPGAEE